MDTDHPTTAWTYAASGEVPLDRQHEVLIHLGESLSEIVGTEGPGPLAFGLGEFVKAKLRHHFRSEEAAVQREGGGAVLRGVVEAHRQLETAFAQLTEALAAGPRERAQRLANAFRAAMAAHDREVDGPMLQWMGRSARPRSTSAADAALRIPLPEWRWTAEARRLSGANEEQMARMPIHDG